MRKRDVAVLVLTLAGLLLAFQQDGALSIRRGFRVSIPDEVSKLHTLPPPVVTDLNGDGKNEVVLLTSRETLAVVNPRHIRRSLFEFTELYAASEALLPSPCIGFSTGYVEKYEEGSRRTREQIIVAVTEDYMVYAYSADLRRLWLQRLPEVDESLFTPTHASVLILPHDVHQADRGMVVVGVDTQKLDLDGAQAAAPGTEAPGSVHFSYYGLNAADGELRWKHDAGSFHPIDAAKPRPLQSYKLSSKHLEHHSGEEDCTVFRRSILAAFPHSHSHPHDTKLRVHHFRRKLRTSEVPTAGATVKAVKAGPTASLKRTTVVVPQRSKPPSPDPKFVHRVPRSSDDSYGELGDRLSGLAGLLRERMSRPHSHTEHILHPNVVVAHLPDRIEVLHLYTGRTLCQFGPLKADQVYDDIDGDTSVDEITTHVQAHLSAPQFGESPAPRCLGAISTGSPGMRKEPLFNASICMKRSFLRQFHILKNLLRQNAHDDEDSEGAEKLYGLEALQLTPSHLDEHTKAALPLVLHHRIAAAKGVRKIHSNVLFYINTGLVTCVDPSLKSVVWQVVTDSPFRGRVAGDEEP
eukprot:RCo037444